MTFVPFNMSDTSPNPTVNKLQREVEVALLRPSDTQMESILFISETFESAEEDRNEVTHEVFFGENIKRVLSILRK
jgi:hypothetical protein